MGIDTLIAAGEEFDQRVGVLDPNNFTYSPFD